jgi:spore maturation protein CgeB
MLNLELLKYSKFKNNEVKILLITSKYFLIGEIINGLKELGIQYDSIVLGDREYLTDEFINLIVSKISSFKPDFTFTINHLGVDREGVLMTLFEKIEMPLISWYVDNPNLIIKHFKKNISDYCTMLVWDKDNINDMKNIGFKNVFYLPLGCDINRFKNIPFDTNPFKALKCNVMFVGNSMILKVKESLKKTKAPEFILKFYKKFGVEFASSNERNVEHFIKNNYPEFYSLFEKLDETNKTNFETTVTWEATRIYRYKCVKNIVKFKPLIVGDKHWRSYFRDKVSYYPEVSYYDELPYFYNLADVNFNTTSLQMKNAVNQRVFDVPACRRFLITDYRKQIEDLFELDKEVICYKNFAQIEELISKYLSDTKERKKIIKNAYKRVISEHKYTNRVKAIINIARKVYS